MVDAVDCPSDICVQLRDVIQKFSVQMGPSYDTTNCVLLHDLLSKRFSTDKFLLEAENHLQFQKHFRGVIDYVYRLPVSDHVLQRLELFFLSGMIAFSRSDRPTERTKSLVDLSNRIGQHLLHYLVHGCSDLQALIISIMEHWWLWRLTLNYESEVLNHNAATLSKSVYSAVLMHWDSDDSTTVRQIRHFLSSMLSGSHEGPMDVISLVQTSILGGPSCKFGCVLLHKGALNLLTPVLKQWSPIKVLEYSPYLTTSLLLALGHNYTAATAADALNVLLMHGSALHTTEDKHIWLEHVLTPLLNYMLFEKLNCSMAQELLGSHVTSPQTVRLNRRENFAKQCLVRNLRTLNLTDLPECAEIRAYCSPEFESGLSLVELLLRCLCSMDSKQNARLASTVQHRLFLWLKLFSVQESKAHLVRIKLDMSPLLTGLLHADDQIRSMALVGIAGLGSAFLSHWDQLADQLDWTCLPDSPSTLMRLFVIGVILLHSSPNPVARKALLSAMDELVRGVRNACTSLRNAFTYPGSSFARLFLESSRGWLPELSLGPISSSCSDNICTKEWTRQELALVWLAQFVDFQSHLWNHVSSSGSDLFPVSLGLFWPGMTYQRCKVLTEVAYHAIGLCNLEHTKNGDNAVGQWRTGYAPNSINNLRRLIRLLSSELKWPFDAPETLSSMLRSLPVLKPDIQTQLFELIQHNWPEMSQTQVSKSDPGCVPHWLHQAMLWSDSHLWAVHTAGANTLTFLATRGYLKEYEGQPSLNLLFNKKLQSLGEVFQTDSQKQGRLLHAAQNETGIGYLMAIDQMLGYLYSGKFSDRIPDDLCRFLMSNQLAMTCIYLCNRCLCVMGCRPWSGTDCLDYTESREGASSFRELGQSVLRAAMSGYLHSCSQDENPGTGCDELVVESIELLPEYQHVLSWSWNTLRLCCNILAQWSALQKQERQRQQQQEPELQKQGKQHQTGGSVDHAIEANILCTHAGYQLLHVLLHCRHRGTVESVSSSLQFYLVAADSGHNKRRNDRGNDVHASDPTLITCEQVLDVCWKVLCNYSYSVTRRAAGLWPAVKAALSAERARGTRRVPDLLIRWLERLIDLASPDSVHNINDLRVDSPRALAMHLLRGLFTDACLHAHTQSITLEDGSKNFVVEAIQRAVMPGFTAPVWTISNAALQLHSALVLRLTGSESGRPPPSATAVFDRYVPLLDVCVNRLEDHVQQAANSSAAELLPLLTLIVRLAPGSGSSIPQGFRMRTGLEHVLLNHTTAAIRQLAASAYLVFLPLELEENGKATCFGDQCALREIASIGPLRLIRMPNCCPTRPVSSSAFCGANAIHGQLCLLRAWYEQPVASKLLVQRQSLFDWSTALDSLHRLMLGPKVGSGTWFLAARLCELMTCIYSAGYNAYWDSSLRPALDTWYRERAQYLQRPPSHQPFHVEALTALYRFLGRVCGSTIVISSDLVDLSGWPENSVQRLLSALLDSDDPRDSALLAVPAVDYLLECRTPQKDLLLSWRIVHVWASAIRSRQIFLHAPSVLGGADRKKFEMLQTLLNTDGPGSADAVNRANVLLCEAVLLNSTLKPTEEDFNHWLNHLSDCLYPACLEPARLTSSEAIRVWLDGLSASCVVVTDAVSSTMTTRLRHALTLQQRHKFLSLLFSTVFDECAEVRHTISRCITAAVGTSATRNALPLLTSGFATECDQPTAHLVAAHLLLHELMPALLARTDNTSVSETTVWLKSRWLEVMFDLNRRLVEEFIMHRRNVLYEREVDNDFCEPRLLLELIIDRLLKEPLTTKQWDSLREELRSNADEHLSELLKENDLTTEMDNVCGTLASIQSFTPTQFARQLGFACLFRKQ